MGDHPFRPDLKDFSTAVEMTNYSCVELKNFESGNCRYLVPKPDSSFSPEFLTRATANGRTAKAINDNVHL